MNCNIMNGSLPCTGINFAQIRLFLILRICPLEVITSISAHLRVPETGLIVAIAIRELVPARDSSQVATPFSSVASSDAPGRTFKRGISGFFFTLQKL